MVIESKDTAKAVKLIYAVAGFGVSTAIVQNQSRSVSYASSLVFGSLIGYYLLSPFFGFDFNYSPMDKYANLKSNIEGMLLGASIGTGMFALRDDKLSNNAKILIASGVGSLLSYELSNNQILGNRGTNLENISAALVGGASVAGLYVLINKKMKK